MPIDKFGRIQKHTRISCSKQRPSGFSLTSRGDYGVQNRRFTNFGEPVDHNDAVSNAFFINKFDEMLKTILSESDAGMISTHIANVLKDYDKENKKDRMKDVVEQLPFVIESDGSIRFKSKAIT